MNSFPSSLSRNVLFTPYKNRLQAGSIPLLIDRANALQSQISYNDLLPQIHPQNSTLTACSPPISGLCNGLLTRIPPPQNLSLGSPLPTGSQEPIPSQKTILSSAQFPRPRFPEFTNTPLSFGVIIPFPTNCSVKLTSTCQSLFPLFNFRFNNPLICLDRYLFHFFLLSPAANPPTFHGAFAVSYVFLLQKSPFVEDPPGLLVLPPPPFSLARCGTALKVFIVLFKEIWGGFLGFPDAASCRGSSRFLEFYLQSLRPTDLRTVGHSCPVLFLPIF